VKKLGLGGRATFISPYLRRPLRPLEKVMSERGDHDEGERAVLRSGDPAHDPASATLGFARKPRRTPD
jgi:hypothetical protein